MSETTNSAVLRLRSTQTAEALQLEEVSEQQQLFRYLVENAITDRRSPNDQQRELPENALSRGFEQVCDEFQEGTGVDIRLEISRRARSNHTTGEATIVLDMGCAKGEAIRDAQQEFSARPKDSQPSEVVCVGADINPLPAQPTDGVVYLEEDVKNIGIPNDAVDVCYCRATLIYVDDALRAIEEIYRTLKPGGVAVISIYSDHICSNVPFAEILENTNGGKEFEYQDGDVSLRGYLVIRKDQDGSFKGFPYKFINADIPSRYVDNQQAPSYTKLFRTARYEYIGEAA